MSGSGLPPSSQSPQGATTAPAKAYLADGQQNHHDIDKATKTCEDPTICWLIVHEVLSDGGGGYCEKDQKTQDVVEEGQCEEIAQALHLVLCDRLGYEDGSGQQARQHQLHG